MNYFLFNVYGQKIEEERNLIRNSMRCSGLFNIFLILAAHLIYTYTHTHTTQHNMKN